VGTDEKSGEKAPEYWLLAFRDTVEKALDQRMCNIIKTADPQLVKMSEKQHGETLDRIDGLVKALYVSCGVVIGLGIVMIGAVFFAVSVLVSR
jgi:hypothetical protein